MVSTQRDRLKQFIHRDLSVNAHKQLLIAKHKVYRESINLFHTLVYTSLATTESNWIAKARQQFSSATELEWQRSLLALELHRLTPLVSYSLERHGLADALPKPYLFEMQESYRQTRMNNAVLLLMLNRILQAMRERNLHPIIWKGIALADSFYPDPGTRPMGDMDFAISPDEMDEATAVFKSLGLLPQSDAETSEAMYFANQIGIICDVHHRVRLFEGKESMNLTTNLKPQHLKTNSLPVLEPNAMIVHLIVHMDGHRNETGPIIVWILDLAFVLRKWGALLELEQLAKLMPTKEHFVSLFRTIRFLEHEFNEKPPECLAEVIKSFEPFTLEEILRQRRLALWGLPRFRGWLRLSASKLGFQLRHSRPELYLSDLFLWFSDALKNQCIGLKSKQIDLSSYFL
ncbi:MAG: nucleotidyltransferase family protein [Symploca sp. SIO2D2]|nr:nucleotidyltransferase family protein [Symploca sp. SIO2D2]